MIIIALDLSTKPGYAVFENTRLVRYGTLFPKMPLKDVPLPYPHNYAHMANTVTEKLYTGIIRPYLSQTNAIQIVIEETTASSQNYSQKILEWIHLSLYQKLAVHEAWPIGIHYIRDGVWKRLTGANQNKEERNWNARISRYKKKHNKTIAKLAAKKGEKPKRVRRLDSKDYAIRAVREIYGLELEREQEDQSDAILLGTAFIWGAPKCTGRDEDGILTDELKETLIANRCPVSIAENVTCDSKESPEPHSALCS